MPGSTAPFESEDSTQTQIDRENEEIKSLKKGIDGNKASLHQKKTELEWYQSKIQDLHFEIDTLNRRIKAKERTLQARECTLDSLKHEETVTGEYSPLLRLVAKDLADSMFPRATGGDGASNDQNAGGDDDVNMADAPEHLNTAPMGSVSNPSVDVDCVAREDDDVFGQHVGTTAMRDGDLKPAEGQSVSNASQGSAQKVRND